MKQLTILAFISNVLQQHRYKRLPRCTNSDCRKIFTEQEFSKLLPTGHNIVWNIDYAECSDCGSEVQGWRRLA